VRIAQQLGIKEIANFSKKMGIYENPEELLSISLGSAETTLLKLTSAYCTFVNGGKKIKPILIDRIQDSEGNTIFNNEKRICKSCNEISYLGNKIPKISDNFEQVISPQTAYQITSILEGVVQRGTAKKLKDLNLNIAGKTGTTNKNTDTWFIGFTSNVLVGVYVGSDNPVPLGKYETGSKTALPIFKSFISDSVNKYDARPFKAAKGTVMMVVDPLTGQKAKFNSKNTIIEVFKKNYNINKPIVKEYVAAISTGIINNTANLDLDYEEDFKADVDANFVICESGKIAEIQVTGEEYFFTDDQFNEMFNLAKKGVSTIIQKQKLVLSE